MDLFNLSARLTLDKSEYESGLADAEKSAKRSGIGDALGKLGKTAAVGIAAGVTAAGAAVVKLTKDAVGAYANYQQLVGGVETLFGAGGQNIYEYSQSVGKSVRDARGDFFKLQEAQDIVMKNAEQAFRTSGLSMNDYMEQVTSFSASLISSLDGDTVAAAKAADRAIIDMSDNANKMGTDMTAIQNAYNGFAKQNYTMLDNLKLGYGGTKTEMERLIKDAAAMTDVQEALGVTVDANSMSFGNVVNAISVMQKSMGIAGTTSKEASTTVSGSMGQMRAAWKNVVTSFAIGGDQLQGSISDLLETAKAMLGNMVPTIEAALAGIGDFLKIMIPELLREVPPMVEKILPSFANSVGKLITGAGKAVRIGIKGLFKIVRNMLKSFAGQEEGEDGFGGIAGAITKLGERIFTAVQKIFRTLFKQVSKLITEVDWLAVGNRIVEMIGNGFNAAMNIFVDAFRSLMSLITSIDWLSVGSAIWGWIKQAFDGLVGWFTTAFTEVSTAIKNNVDWSAVGSFILEAIETAIDGAVTFFTNLFNDAADAIKSVSWSDVGQQIWDWISGAFNGIVEWFKGLFTESKDGAENDIDWAGLGSSILNLITSAFDAIYETFKTIFENAWQAISDVDWVGLGKSIWTWLTESVSNIASDLKGFFENATKAIEEINWAELGTNIWTWITDAFSNIWNAFQTIFSSGKDGAETGVDWAGLGTAIWDFIKAAFSGLYDAFQGFFKQGWQAVQDIKWDEAGLAIWNGIISLIKTFGTWLLAIGNFALAQIKTVDWLEVGQKLWDGVTGLIGDLASSLWDIFTNAVDYLLNFTRWGELGQAVLDGIKSKAAEIQAWLEGLWNSITHPGSNWTAEERESQKRSSWENAEKNAYFKKAYDMARMFTSPTVLSTPRGNMTFGDGVGGEIVMSDRKLEKIAGGRETAMAIGMLTDAVNDLSDSLTEKMALALQQMGFSIDGREFARLVRDVRTA